MLTGCPDEELNDVALSDCAENFGQVQKAIVFWLRNTDGTKIKFSPNAASQPTDPALAANWITIFGASDRTKPVETPGLAEPDSQPGAKREYGGGNATPNGVRIVIGREPQDFVAKILSQNQTNVIKPLKSFEKGNGVGKPKLGVVLINEAGQFLFDSNAEADDNADLELYPIPMAGFHVSDMGFGMLEGVDMNMIEWQFLPNWSDNLKVWTPTNFDALEPMKTLS